MDKMNYGWIEPVITDSHYVEGDGRLFGATDLNPSGDWEKWLPKYEAQADKYETFGCVTFGATNQSETLHSFMFDTEPNYSERYLYNLVGVNPPGTDPQNVYEAIRKCGLLSQEVLPMPETLKEFRTPRPMTDNYILEGKKWKDIYYFDHDWLLTGTPNPEKLRTKLKSCPIGVSVTAWNLKDGVYIDNGQPNNHWCLLYKMDNDFYYVFDSYFHDKKKLPIKGHKICYAKRIVLYKRTEVQNTFLDIIRQFLNIFKGYADIIKRGAKVAGEIVDDTFSKTN